MWFSLCYKNSVMMLMFLMFMMNMFWCSSNQMTAMMMSMILYMNLQLKKTKLMHLKSLLLVVVSMFITVLYMNIVGLLPYMFSPSSHIIMTTSLALPLWTMLIMSSMKSSMKMSAGHLLPDSAPLWLSPFLILIESISMTVRPLTLSFRLAANMTAGHIILSLMSMFSTKLSMKNFIVLMLMTSMYTMFELGICLVQAYIFCLLVSLYSNDHP